MTIDNERQSCIFAQSFFCYSNDFKCLSSISHFAYKCIKCSNFHFFFFFFFLLSFSFVFVFGRKKKERKGGEGERRRRRRRRHEMCRWWQEKCSEMRTGHAGRRISFPHLINQHAEECRTRENKQHCAQGYSCHTIGLDLLNKIKDMNLAVHEQSVDLVCMYSRSAPQGHLSCVAQMPISPFSQLNLLVRRHMSVREATNELYQSNRLSWVWAVIVFLFLWWTHQSVNEPLRANHSINTNTSASRLASNGDLACAVIRCFDLVLNKVRRMKIMT